MPSGVINSILTCHRLFLGCVLLLAGTARAAEPERVVLQLPYLHQFQFAGIYAAQAQGYFREHGLEVEIRATNAQRRSALVEVQEGRAQFGVTQGPQLVASRLAGQPFVAVAAIMQHSPLVLLTRAEDNLHTPHDLIGKRVALDATALVSEIRLMFEREGVDFSRLQVVPNEWNREELKDNLADAESAFLIDGPYLRQRAGLRVSIIRPLDYGVDFYGDTLFTSEAFLRERRGLVEAMRLAVLQGWAYALQHPEEMVDWIISQLPDRNPALDRPGLLNEARRVAALINPDLVEIGHMNSGRWAFMGGAMARYTAGLDQSRLPGFLYDAPEAGVRKLGWLVGILGLAVVVALAALLANRRLQSLVRRRTQELAVAEQRQRDYFELAPVPIVIEDCSALEPVLARFRAEGVTDLRAHLRAQPGLLAELVKLKRVVAANRIALARSGFATVAAFNEGLPGIMTADTYASFVEELVALWLDLDRLTLERSYRTVSGEVIDSILNWEVSRNGGRRDLANVRLVFTEITEQKKAAQALRQSEERYRLHFEQAPLAVAEFDYSRLRGWFEELRGQGVTDLGAYIEAHPEAKETILVLAPLVDVNQSALALLGARSKAELVARLREVITDSTIAVRTANAMRIWNGTTLPPGSSTSGGWMASGAPSRITGRCRPTRPAGPPSGAPRRCWWTSPSGWPPRRRCGRARNATANFSSRRSAASTAPVPRAVSSPSTPRWPGSSASTGRRT